MKKTLIAAALVAAQLATAARAEEAASQSTEAPKTGFRAEALFILQHHAKKLLRLAEAVPEDKWGWRPAEGVRSLGRLYMHIASANYGIPKMIGVKPPAAFTGFAYEKSVNGKEKISEAVRASLEHVKQAILQTSDADLDVTQKRWGRDMSKRMILLMVLGHIGEHLGQLAVYARQVGVVPPWVPEQQKMFQKMREKMEKEQKEKEGKKE